MRRGPPELGSRVLLRTRLLAALLHRFDRRVVCVTAPAGFGKTTLLAQALVENALAPRGVDAWVSCEPGDATASTLLGALSTSLGMEAEDPPTVGAVADAVLLRSPLEVALVLDDVHEVPAGSAGAALVEDLIAALPQNGHVVLAGRTEPPMRLARLVADGQVVRVGEDDLRLTPDELEQVAALNEVPAAPLTATSGWPALVSLTLTAGPDVAERYVWEEVLDRLTPADRRAVAALVTLGGADADLLRAAVCEEVDADRLPATVPLVERLADGSLRPHALWGPVLAGVLDDDEARTMRRRAAEVLHARGDLARAAELVLPALDHDEDWAVMRELISHACQIARWVARADLLAAWLAALPDERAGEPAALLLRAGVGRLQQVVGEDTRPLLEEALDTAHERGETRVELSALSHLGHIAWWQEDIGTLLRLHARSLELEAAGWVEARGPAAIGRAMVAQAAYDHERVLGEVERVDRSRLDPGMAAGVDWLHARALIGLGRAAEAVSLADRAVAEPSVAFQAARAERLIARWFCGRMVEAVALLDELDASAERLPRDRFLLGVIGSGAHALLGRVDESRRLLAVAEGAVGSVEGPRPRLFLGHTRTLLLLAEGDEEGAATELRAALGDEPFTPALLGTFRVLLGGAYVLLPERRDELGALDVGPDQWVAIDVARALVAHREGAAADLTWPPERVLGVLGLRLGLELACRAGDERLGRFLLDHCQPAGRVLLRSWAAGEAPADRAVVAGARRLLKSLPSPPSLLLRLRTLGPVALERDGEPVAHPDWRRERVRSLLLLLVARRRVTREVAATELWPDLDGEAAAGNLRVTLGYLHKVLEPDRTAGDAAWFVRSDGDALALTSEGLDVDAWQLETLLDEAAAAEAAGAPTVALAAYEDALGLWRGDHLQDVYDDWAAPERDRIRARFLAASVRAGELLLGRGDTDRALLIGTRAVEAEPWSEAAHRLVLAAHLTRGDRASARHALDRCYRALEELGVDPEPATAVFERAILDPASG